MPWLTEEPSEQELARLDYARTAAVNGELGDWQAEQASAAPSLADAVASGASPLPPEASERPSRGAPGAAGAEPPPYLDSPPTLTPPPVSSDPSGAKRRKRYQKLTRPTEGARVEHWRRVEALKTLRAASQHATDRQILSRDGTGYPEPCGVDGHVQRRLLANDVVERRFVVDHCQRRDRCPTCSTAYGEEKGRELGQVLDMATAAATDRRPSDPLGWGWDVTFPEAVTALLEARIDAGDVKGARWVLDKAVGITEQVIWWIMSRWIDPDDDDKVKRREKLERDSLMMALNAHLFHSSRPLSDHLHLHVHGTLANVTAVETGEITGSGRKRREPGPVVRHHGWLPKALIQGAREYAEKRIRATFGKLVDLSAYTKGNWHVFGIYNRGTLRKYADYCNRSPWHDVAKLEETNPSRVYSDAGMRSLALFTERQAFIQSALRVRRFKGALSPGSRRLAGMRLEEADDGPRWENEMGGYRAIERYDASGLWLRSYQSDGEPVEAWGGAVLWGPRSPPFTWRWTDSSTPESTPSAPS